jgi:nitrile hydratase accessory protein
MKILAGMPCDSTEPVFREPWEARAFAIALRLHERGLFTWPEWAAALSDEIAAAGAQRQPYYAHWLHALESLVERSGAGSRAELDRFIRAWEHAAMRTPHGQPIELTAPDLSHCA